MISSLFHRDQLQPRGWSESPRQPSKKSSICGVHRVRREIYQPSTKHAKRACFALYSEDGKISVRPQMDHIRAAESACRRSPMHCTCGNAPQLRYQSLKIPDKAGKFIFLGIDGVYVWPCPGKRRTGQDCLQCRYSWRYGGEDQKIRFF